MYSDMRFGVRGSFTILHPKFLPTRDNNHIFNGWRC